MSLRFEEEAAQEFYRAIQYYESQSSGFGAELPPIWIALVPSSSPIRRWAVRAPQALAASYSRDSRSLSSTGSLMPNRLLSRSLTNVRNQGIGLIESDHAACRAPARSIQLTKILRPAMIGAILDCVSS